LPTGNMLIASETSLLLYRARRTGRSFIVRLEMLLHVVRAQELLFAGRVGAGHRLFACMDLGVARRVTGGCEGLGATMRLSKAARISPRFLRQPGLIRTGAVFT
jgi:hypothetical protein